MTQSWCGRIVIPIQYILVKGTSNSWRWVLLKCSLKSMCGPSLIFLGTDRNTKRWVYGNGSSRQCLWRRFWGTGYNYSYPCLPNLFEVAVCSNSYPSELLHHKQKQCSQTEHGLKLSEWIYGPRGNKQTNKHLTTTTTNKRNLSFRADLCQSLLKW